MVGDVDGVTYFPQLEHEQLEPQLPVKRGQHRVTGHGGKSGGRVGRHTAGSTGASAFALHDDGNDGCYVVKRLDLMSWNVVVLMCFVCVEIVDAPRVKGEGTRGLFMLLPPWPTKSCPTFWIVPLTAVGPAGPPINAMCAFCAVACFVPCAWWGIGVEWSRQFQPR